LAEGGAIVGARFIDAAGILSEARAKATLVATGGAGQVYRETTNPAVACGDGVALAYLAGARVADLEFVQFHPTVLAVPGAPRYLLTEALRGEGAKLVNEDDEPFMTRYEAEGDLAPRDRVARAILRERDRTGRPVYLSLRHLPADDVRARFPSVAELCGRVGLDLATDRLPVGPAAHYLMGGVATDLEGRTSLPGLFAAGEVACTGVHGANRLASNSLLEGLVFGARAGRAMLESSRSPWPDPMSAPFSTVPPAGPAPSLSMSDDDVRELMWREAGVFREGDGLARAEATLEPAWQAVTAALSQGAGLTPDRWRSISLVTIARLIVRAARRREESRGAHWRRDCPERDDLHWARREYEVRDVHS
jgi:L-aspartate oxidase